MHRLDDYVDDTLPQITDPGFTMSSRQRVKCVLHPFYFLGYKYTHCTYIRVCMLLYSELTPLKFKNTSILWLRSLWKHIIPLQRELYTVFMIKHVLFLVQLLKLTSLNENFGPHSRGNADSAHLKITSIR